MKNPRPRQTFWCEQAEFLGGAERFSLDFFQQLTPTEQRLLRLTILGAEHPGFKKALPEGITVRDFKFPAVSGGLLRKLMAVWQLLWQARGFRKCTDKRYAPQWVTNTPRGHFLLFLAKVIWRLPGRWISIFHDFTTRPAWLLTLIARRSDVLIANSIPTRNYLRKVLPESHHSKIRIIENGVNFLEVPKETPAPTELKKLLHLGRIDPRKGQLYTAQAADLLKESHSQLQFTFVGSSVAQDPRTVAYDHQLEQFINSRNLVSCYNKSEVHDPFAEIATHDALLVCPTEPETFGRIVIEGLSCNKLVISFNRTGPREILTGYHQWLIKKGHLPRDADNKLLVEPNNHVKLADTIAYFAKHSDQVELYAQHGREYVEKYFNLTETKKRLVDVLTNV